MSICHLVTLLLLSACTPAPTVDFARENEKLKAELAQRDKELANQKLSVQEMNSRLAAAQGLDEKQLKTMFYPEKLQFERLSGGFDSDGKPGDDGVVVYLRPIDAAGDAIKAAGDIRIQLFDLANAPGDTFVGECAFPAEEISKYWYGSLMTYHYTLKCPWPKGPPKHPDITVRVTFVNRVPLRVITDQTVVKVRLP